MPPGFRMTIGADPGEVARVNAAFAEFADGHGIPTGVQRSINTALDELLANALTYGRAREAIVEVVLCADRLCVTVSDDGRAFDPLATVAPDTTLSTAARPIGGLGIHLVRNMMDSMSYRFEGGRNVITLEKQLAKEDQ